ncbi:copper-binding transcription factor [Onygenales sp. PD_40]|nr:copper-binding transcription factor [Onygenales sp. PD_40]
MQLRKGATFHSPTTPPSADTDPILNIPSLPRRSPTCPRLLEDAIAAGEKRMASFLDNFDRTLSGLGSDSLAKSSLSDDDLPVPRGILDARIVHTDPLSTDADSHPSKAHQRSQANSPHRHSSDSGIGTSVSGTNMSASTHPRDQGMSPYRRCLCSTPSPNQHDAVSALRKAGSLRRSLDDAIQETSNHSAITRSIPYANNTATPQIPTLGPAACKQIERFILVPILSQKRLSPFHRLVRSVPGRIENKEVTCLRDLEKTLLYLAPVSKIHNSTIQDLAHTICFYLKKFAISKAAYLGFCEFTIQCLHTTVGHLNQRDQTRPADRPYTNGYFLDLVGQIRQYATMVNAARERQGIRPRSNADQNMEYSSYVDFLHASTVALCSLIFSDEELTLEGGLGATGRPAEFVRRKKGQAISLRTGEPFEDKAAPAAAMLKRSLSMESCDDSVSRSMARRKKNEPPLNINKKCNHCDKVFKRPCDLTKHEKTHSRPWKCKDESCKYFRIGWPTEKERDRHVNDKHSASPALYKCHFSPCTYQSKRESNCKQHMEKAHNWVYVRSKNNGKNGKRTPSISHPTPQTPNIPTPNSGMMNMATPMSATVPSPYMPSASPFEQNLEYTSPNNYSMNDVMGHEQDFQLYGDAPAPTYEDLQLNFDFDAFRASLEASDPNEYVPALDFRLPSVDSSTHDHIGTGVMDQTPFDPSHPSHDLNYDFDNMNDEYTTMNLQLMTPVHSVESRTMDSFSRNSSICGPSPTALDHNICNLSPAGQGNVMLYSPNSQDIDEGYHEHMGKPNADFTLFESPIDTNRNGMHGQSSGNFGGDSNFPSLDNFSTGQFSNTWTGEINPMDLHRDDDFMMDQDQF